MPVSQPLFDLHTPIGTRISGASSGPFRDWGPGIITAVVSDFYIVDIQVNGVMLRDQNLFPNELVRFGPCDGVLAAREAQDAAT